MSTRSQVKLISNDFSTPIFLYQHYDGYALYKIVNNAISRQTRWNDPEYLARIIFSEMLINGGNDEHPFRGLFDSTGYGIGTEQHGDIEYLVEVDIEMQTVTEWEGYGNDWKVINSTTFKDAKTTSKEHLYEG